MTYNSPCAGEKLGFRMSYSAFCSDEHANRVSMSKDGQGWQFLAEGSRQQESLVQNASKFVQATEYLKEKTFRGKKSEQDNGN